MSGWSVPGYTETKNLGAGATGRVVAAVHDETGTEVAIKYLSPRFVNNPDFVERFRTEAALLAEIRHPNVVQLFDYVESESGAGSAMVMELVAGPTLHRMLHENGRMGPEAALSVMRGSLLGLGAAHQMGIVHRDYKPSNVLLNAYGISKLADFGVAERAEPIVETDPDATMPGGVGTPAYMAPEQWDGAPAQPVTDIYAVTASFFECLTGKVPYSADTVYELEEKHRTAPIPLDQVPEGIQALIAHGLAKDPAERPQDVSSFVAEIERIATENYGVEWEERGRREIAVLLPLFGFGFIGPDGPENLEAPDGMGSDGPEPEGEDGAGGHRPFSRRMPDRFKLGAAVAGVAAIILAIAAVAVAGNSKPTHQATPPGSTSEVFTPTPGGPTGSPTGGDFGAAPTVAVSSSSSSSSSTSSSTSSSASSSSSWSSPSSPSPSNRPSSRASSPTSVPTKPPTSGPSSAPSTSVATTPPTSSSSSTPPVSIDAVVSVVSDPPGQCVASYDVTFRVGNAPGGSVNVTYTWHLASGSTTAEGPVTLKANSSQSFGIRETSNGTTNGTVFVTWSANGNSGTSNSTAVTITCIK